MSGIERGIAGLPLSEASLWDGPRVQPPSQGSWWSPFGMGNINATPVVGELYTAPFLLPSDCILNGLGIFVAASPSNDAVLKIGLHDHDVRMFMPSKLVYATTEMTGAPLAANSPSFVLGLNVALRRGVYWLGYLFTAGTTLTNAISCAPVATTDRGSLGFRVYPTSTSTGGPLVAAGNDGSIAKQTGLTDVPGIFGGTVLNNSNSPNRPAAIFLLTSSGRTG